MKRLVLLLSFLAAGFVTGALADAPVVHARYSPKGPSNIDMFGPHGVFVSVTNGVVDAETQTPSGDADLSFWFSCTYDAAGLAVKVVVLDDDARRADTCPSNAISCAAWDDDAVEIFIDAECARLPNSRADGGVHLKHGGEVALVANGAANSDYSGYPNTFFRVDQKHFAKKGTAELSGMANSTNAWWSGCAMPFTIGAGNKDDLSKLTLYTFYVPWAAMGRTSRPDRIGFNISVQDDDGGGRRDHALYWVGNPKRPYSDESAFGILVFDPSTDARAFGSHRMNWRLLRSVGALSLPTVVVVVLGVRFLVEDVPVMVRDEKARVRAATEHAAKAMREDPLLADFVWERGRGVVRGVAQFGDYPADMSWKDWNPESGTKRRDMWGWRVFDGGRLVWARGVGEKDGETVYVRWTDIEERDYAFMFYMFVPLFLLVLVGITFLGARFFVDYVRSRDDFLAATAHDLTTPLVGMRYSIGRNDEEAKALNERMIRLVTNIKDFLRLGGKRPKPQRDEVDLVKCYEEAYALFREDVRDVTDGSDIPVAMGTDPTEPLKNGPFAGPVPNFVAVGDETLVVQILWNLIGNDLKYALPFGPVRVRFYREDGFVNVEFADEGQGMSPCEMARAFDRYYRAKTVLESGKGGFGIGLCTAREFARSMGGDLSVRANSPHGCVFTLSLPAAKEGGK